MTLCEVHSHKHQEEINLVLMPTIVAHGNVGNNLLQDRLPLVKLLVLCLSSMKFYSKLLLDHESRQNARRANSVHLDLASSEEFGILAGLTTHRSLAVSRSFRISGY